MRLPADATLIVLDAEAPGVALETTVLGSPAANVAALIAAWRRERLPIVASPGLASGEAQEAHNAAPRQDERSGEHAVTQRAASAFDGSGLEGLLEEIGATTLVLCGPAAKVAASARDAAALGYQVYVVVDSCGGADAGAALAALAPDIAALTDAAQTLAAAGLAKFRERWKAGRSRRGQ
jgi:nicotinamidase-related amidase